MELFSSLMIGTAFPMFDINEDFDFRSQDLDGFIRFKTSQIFRQSSLTVLLNSSAEWLVPQFTDSIQLPDMDREEEYFST